MTINWEQMFHAEHDLTILLAAEKRDLLAALEQVYSTTLPCPKCGEAQAIAKAEVSFEETCDALDALTEGMNPILPKGGA
jgi:deoxycytidylate deaminase